jgi:6-pyruvoyl-tetrahydropterin synthase
MSEGMEFEDAMRLVAEIRNRPNTSSATRAVARRYPFRAHHHIEGVAEPWCHDHWHDYIVEVVAEAQAPPDGSMVIDTDELDRIWYDRLESRFRGDLNQSTPTTTTVEALAAWILYHFPDIVREVTVWEDDDRWGRARR